MNVLVIGASGLVGTACYNLFNANKQNSVVGTFRNYNNNANCYIYFNPTYEDKNSTSVFDKHWDLVIHTAALTNVDMCEQEPERSYADTVLTTKLIVEKLANANTHFAYISTDYVFDGEGGPYYENDEPNPINIYGKHKLEAEQIIQASLKNYSIIRVTNVYGEEDRNKNFIARLTRQLANNEITSITTPVDQFATPIYAGDIAVCIREIFSNQATGIFHAASTDYYNRYQLVLKVLSFFPNSHLSVNAVATSTLGQAAKRPLRGGLINSRLYMYSPQLSFTNIDSYLKKNIHDI